MRRVSSPAITPLNSHRSSGTAAQQQQQQMRRGGGGLATTPSAATRGFQTQPRANSMWRSSSQHQQLQQSQQQPRGSALRTTTTPRGVAQTLDEISARAATAARQLRTASPALNSARGQQPSTSDPPAAPPTLRHDEIRRIVEKVERHFAPQIEHLNAQLKEQLDENELLRTEVDALTQQIQQQQQNQQGGGGSGSRAGASQIEALRAELQREKRARFECEEQSHKMAEEHAKLVETLERRLRKSESLVAELQQQLAQPARPGTAGGTPRSARHQISATVAANSAAAAAAAAANPTSTQNQQQQQLQSQNSNNTAAGGGGDPPTARRDSASFMIGASTPQHQQQQRASGAAGSSSSASGGRSLGASASSPLVAPTDLGESGSFFEAIARQLDDINSREASRSALIRQII